MRRRNTPPTAALPLLLLCAGPLAACTGSHPFVRRGDEKSVEVGYSGDIANAWPVARHHCAAYERLARLTDSSPDTAYFDCVLR